jgi:hypothetical protein
VKSKVVFRQKEEALKQSDAKKTYALVEAFYNERMKAE